MVVLSVSVQEAVVWWFLALVCRRLWYDGLSRSARNSLQMAYTALCINATPV